MINEQFSALKTHLGVVKRHEWAFTIQLISRLYTNLNVNENKSGVAHVSISFI